MANSLLTKDNFMTLQIGNLLECKTPIHAIYEITSIDTEHNTTTGSRVKGTVTCIYTTNFYVSLGGTYGFNFSGETIEKEAIKYTIITDASAIKVLYGK